MTQLDEALERSAVLGYGPHLRSHIEAAADHLRNDSEEMRKCSPEQLLYHEYVEAGAPHGPALYAVKGEHWNGVSPKFLEFVNAFQFDRATMGYAESGYGIQRHRNFLRALIVREHDLTGREPAAGLDIDVGCLAMTTRMAMYDMAKVAIRQAKENFPGKTPVALVPTPGWDYRGIFKDVGFEVVFLPLTPKNGWLPDLEAWDAIVRDTIADGTRHVAMAVTNPQHNPTGMQWPVTVTQYLLELAAHHGGFLLLDDAYYCVHDPRVPRVNHLKAVLDAFDRNDEDNELVATGMFDRWVATRPFGKQFSCNTMGVAAITTSPRMLRQLSRESWINRYHTNTHNAELMCAWLATSEAAAWTIETGLFYTRQKELVRTRLKDRMGWPDAGLCVGPSTSYMLIEIPKVYQRAEGGIDCFRDDLFFATGTLVSASLFNQTAPVPFVRLHLGSHPNVIEEFLRRWQAAGLHYDMPKPFGRN
ncbi:pyridoxal phosphate-dependent aminotransferase [Mycobacterium szulgai]|uniref:pyridoxal phosphate-dependent aminotransferase n=1 Tax=Mycobacterium szulgai TaxID=1787 RepID=UPI000A1EA090|nr:pyridoxal phosphate-dependent aminotransferase [Mycobacterium szulgai]MCV7075011.1 pyridoxal phosphate-dependent aminotransferase [Mycobacterium szulgai]